MGRSLLSIKLAVAFGVCVAALVLVLESVRPAVADVNGAGTAVPVAVMPPAAVPAPEAGEVVCLWRACPGDALHVRPGAAAPRRIGKVRIAVRT